MLADNYDKEAHDRLLAKAHSFCASVASKYGAPAPIALPAVECVRAEGDEPAYMATIAAHDALYEGATLTGKAPHGIRKLSLIGGKCRYHNISSLWFETGLGRAHHDGFDGFDAYQAKSAVLESDRMW